MNLTVPRHFDRREWGSIFDRLMNQDQLESPLDDLENIKNYIYRYVLDPVMLSKHVSLHLILHTFYKDKNVYIKKI